MANRFSGSYRNAVTRARRNKDSMLPRGIGKLNRATKRAEAEARNAATPHERRARHRKGKCACK